MRRHVTHFSKRYWSVEALAQYMYKSGQKSKMARELQNISIICFKSILKHSTFLNFRPKVNSCTHLVFGQASVQIKI